jgi:hypothetical protein
MKTKRAETAQHYKEVWKQLYKQVNSRASKTKM